MPNSCFFNGFKWVIKETVSLCFIRVLKDLFDNNITAKYYSANKVALVYPGHETYEKSGRFFAPEQSKLPAENDECSPISIGMEDNVQRWQKKISDTLKHWMR